MNKEHSNQSQNEKLGDKKGDEHLELKNASSDDSLAALYQIRKSKFKAPSSILNHIENNHRPALSIFEHMLSVVSLHFRAGVICASITLAVLVIAYQPHTPSATFNTKNIVDGQTVSYTNVQIHVLENEASFSKGGETFQYSAAKKALLAQQTKQTELKQMMRVIQHEGSLQLVNCEQELIEISKQALELLLSKNLPKLLDEQQTLDAGDMLALTINQEGYILTIEEGDTPLLCT